MVQEGHQGQFDLENLHHSEAMAAAVSLMSRDICFVSSEQVPSIIEE